MHSKPTTLSACEGTEKQVFFDLFVKTRIAPAVFTCSDSFKAEAIHSERFLTRSEAKYQTVEYIKVYYSRNLLHSKLGYVCPELFEAKKVA
jgi:hypothetical protein